MSAQFALPRFLCTKKAAQLTGLSYRTLEKHRMRGTGPKYSKVGGRILYAVNDLMEWIEHGAKRSTSEPETIPPGKQINHSKRIKQVQDSTIIVEVEAAEPALLGTAEAARFLGLSVHTLADHRTYGTGPQYRKVGRRIFYTESDLTEWAERGAQRSTTDPRTVLPARPVDQVKVDEPIPDGAIAVDAENARPVKPVDEVSPVEPTPDSAIIADVEATETTKLNTPTAILRLSVRTLESHGVHGRKLKCKLPSLGMPPATSATRGRKRTSCSRRSRPAGSDLAWIAPIPARWPDSQASINPRVSTKLRRLRAKSKRLRRRHGQACPGWERRDKPGDRWLRPDAKRLETALLEGGAR